MDCQHNCPEKKIVVHQICGPDEPYCGPSLPTPSQYLYWSTRPIICYTSTDETKRSWNLKRRTPNIPDVHCEEMYDKCGDRYFWNALKSHLKAWNKNENFVKRISVHFAFSAARFCLFSFDSSFWNLQSLNFCCIGECQRNLDIFPLRSIFLAR